MLSPNPEGRSLSTDTFAETSYWVVDSLALSASLVSRPPNPKVLWRMEEEITATSAIWAFILALAAQPEDLLKSVALSSLAQIQMDLLPPPAVAGFFIPIIIPWIMLSSGLPTTVTLYCLIGTVNARFWGLWLLSLSAFTPTISSMAISISFSSGQICLGSLVPGGVMN